MSCYLISGCHRNRGMVGCLQIARVPTHLSFGKHKGEAIADLATHSYGAGYLKWLLKQDTVDPYLAEACKNALEQSA